ncbi:MAG: hypothetical protein ABII27_02855 [bacterium]
MKKCLLMFFLLMGFSMSAKAGIIDDLNQAVSDVEHDYGLIGQWMSENLSDGIAKSSVGGIDMPAKVCRQLGFEFGLSLGGEVWKIDRDTFRGLNTRTIDVTTAGDIDLPDTIGMPAGVLHFKLGLPMSFDLGAKVGSVSRNFDEADSEFTLDNSVFGVELRKQVIGQDELSGVMFPDVSVNLSIDGSNGKLEKREVYYKVSDVIYNNSNYAQTVRSTTTWESSWNTGQIGLKVVMSKRLAFLTPFGGFGVGKNFGDTKTSISTVGDLVLSPDLGPNQTKQLNIVSKSKDTADDVVLRFFAGMELNIALFHAGLNLSASKDAYAGYLNLRFEYR